MKICLSGFMGSGKSTFLNLLRDESWGTFLDLDELIFDSIGKTNEDLGQAIERIGWESFRLKESEILKEVLSKDENVFLSLGGGTLETLENLELILAKSKLVFLDTPIEECWSRVQNEKQRPLVKNGQKAFYELYSGRLSQYNRANLKLSLEAQRKITKLEQIQQKF